MQRIVFFTLLATACWAQQQYRDSKTAAIISDSRYLSGDGNFGSAYSQEDGIQVKEETDGNGDRRGSYSYIDPTGQRRTVTYTAGKNGFRASGDGVPVAPPPVAPIPQYQPPQQQYQQPAQQRYQPAPQPQQPARAPQSDYTPPVGYDDGSYRPEYNDPDYDTKYGKNRGAPRPQNPINYNYNSQPAYRPPAPQPQQPVFRAQQPAPYTTTTTPAPHRFYPPGRLDLNRTPDGFSYTFNKN